MKSIQEIKSEFEKAPEDERSDLFKMYETDERKGVQALIARFKKIEEKAAQERLRMYEMFSYERQYRPEGLICGIDEAGRGPLAGPVVAGAVVLPDNCDILYLNDSKQLTPAKRESLYDIIMEKAVAVGIGYCSAERIDEINILQATYEAMREAVSKLSVKPQIFLNDAVTIPGIEGKQVPIIKGDAKSASIAAASIVAKVTRDRLMEKYDAILPGYDFKSNKGYGSKSHIEAIKHLGPSPIHRHSFIGHFV